jgi:hypothetical protein
MREVIELNNRLVGQLGKCSSDSVLMLGREDQPEELKRLPVAFQADIEALRSKINAVVPDDFKYTLCLGDDEPEFMLDYEDGAQMGFFKGREWQLDRCIVEQLEEFDWDAERQQAIAGCQMFDNMAADTKDAPSRLPSTKEIQKAFRDKMREFVKTKRKDALEVHVMLWRDDEGVKEETYDDMKSFCWALPDIMTVHYLVITVVADGKPLPVERIESLKKQAVKELEGMPISHAKALWKL